MIEEAVAEYVAGASLTQVSARTGIPVSTLRKHVIEAGALRSRTDGVRLAAEQGRLGSGYRGKSREFSEETRKKMAQAQLRRAERDAKGVSIKASGYVVYTRGPHKDRSQHVVIVEQQIGRRLLPNEVVHHDDEVKSNNQPSNLKLMARSEHARLHGKEFINRRTRDEKGRLI